MQAFVTPYQVCYHAKTQSTKTIMRIALQQMDNLGDVILAFPMAALIKKKHPKAKIILIARESSRAVAALCADIDEFYAASSKEEDGSAQIQNLQDLKLDVLIHVATGKKPILKWAKAARIPLRIGSLRRLHHIMTCNRFVYVKRQRTPENEAVLNTKLLKSLGIDQHLSFAELNNIIHLNPLPELSPKVAAFLDPKRFNLVIHPGSSAQHTASKEWPEGYYLKLLELLDPKKYNIMVTGVIGTESERFKHFIEDPRVQNLMGQLNIPELVQLIEHSDALLCGSTGPLHIAGLLNKKCLGLYLPHPSKNATGWGPFGSNSEIITAENCSHCQTTLKPKEDACQCMRTILPETVAERINRW